MISVSFLPFDRKMLRRASESTWSYCLNFMGLLTAWLVFPLENRFFTYVRRNKTALYPNVDFDRLQPLDPLRIFFQSVYLLLFYTGHEKREESGLVKKWKALRARCAEHLASLQQTAHSKTEDYCYVVENAERKYTNDAARKAALFFASMLCLGFSILCIIQPLDLQYHLFMMVPLMIFGLILQGINHRVATIVLLLITVLAASRYMWWRGSETIHITTLFSTFCCLALFAAEIYTYVVTVLGFFQTGWTLERKPIPLPKDTSSWPTVDVFIPTYNEPLEVVRPTIFGAQNMDWPKEKMRVFILDDGGREEFRRFAKEIGVGYIARSEHNHAKAGNINNALKLTNSDLVAIFDCDHVPVRSFLQMTVGWLVADPKMAFVQTPHHFYSQDPFQKNLKLGKEVPSENSMFHDFVQKGNDLWNSTMFCGSCAVFRRAALDEIGGIAVETVTEDAHTSLKLSARGWNSAFISIPLAAGLATESLSDHIKQRIRWARGQIQILRINNPLFMSGLSIPQRLCSFNASLFFLHGFSRIVFLLAPLPFIFGNVFVIFANGLTLLAYLIPYMFLVSISLRAISQKARNPFWSAIYETVLCFYIIIPTTLALIKPSLGKFNVTKKGGAQVEKDFFDWQTAAPYLIVFFLNFIGLLYGFWRLQDVDFSMGMTILVNCGWILYNLLFLSAAFAVGVEVKQWRASPRIHISVPVSVTSDDYHYFAGVMTDFSQNGVNVQLKTPKEGERFFKAGTHVTIGIPYDGAVHNFKADVRHVDKKGNIGMMLAPMTLEQERDFSLCTFSRSDTWSLEDKGKIDDSYWGNVKGLFRISGAGIVNVIQLTPAPASWFLKKFYTLFHSVFSLIPHPVSNKGSSR